MSDFKASSEVRAALSAEIVQGAKIPHTTSQPLVRMHQGQPVLAAFAFVYAASDMKTGMMPRPQLWLIADMMTGVVIERYECAEHDFSEQSHDARFSIRWEPPTHLDTAYFAAAYGQLDLVRREFLSNGVLDKDGYRSYFDKIVGAVPPDYRVFYRELGSPDAL